MPSEKQNNSTRKLAAILFADIVGYTSMMQSDEDQTMSRLQRYQEVLNLEVSLYKGEIIKNYGDGSLCLFTSVLDAVNCAKAVQESLREEPKVPLRIGLHLGDVMYRGNDIYGNAINVASRIESMGVSGSILMSKDVQKKIKNQSSLLNQSLGTFEFKNVEEPMEVFALANEGMVVPKKEEIKGKLKTKKDNNRIYKALTFNVLIGFLLVLVVGQFVYNRYWDSGDVDTAKLEKSIAVLPFKNMSSNSENQHFCDGMMDAILNHLSKIPDLRVVSRTSVEQYRENLPLLKKIAEDLNVNYLVEGSVQRIDDKAVIIAQLIYAPTDDHIWSQDYNRDLTDVFAVQAEVTEMIAEELQATISPEIKTRIEDVPTTNMEAYDLYLRGSKYYSDYRIGHDEADLNIAEKFYEEALQIDSTFASVYVELGWTNIERSGRTEWLFSNIQNFSFNEKSKENMTKSRKYAEKALALDSTIASAYLLRSYYYQSSGVYNKVKNDLNKALSLDPNNSKTYHLLGWLNYMNDNDVIGAIGNFKKALTFEGDGVFKSEILTGLGYIYSWIDAYEVAEAYYRRAIRMVPNNIEAFGALSYNYLLQSKYKESASVVDTICNINPDSYECNYGYAEAFKGLKEFDRALEYLNKVEQMEHLSQRQKRVNDLGLIYVHQQLGNTEKAKELTQSTLDYWTVNKGPNAISFLSIVYATIGEKSKAIDYLKQSLPMWKQFGLYTYLENESGFESVSDDKEILEIIATLKEEIKIIREKVFALEAAGEL